MGRIRSGLFRLGRMGLASVADSLAPALNETTRVFGERVRKRRQELGLKRGGCCGAVRVHWTQLGKVERGQRSLRLETIVKIAAGLDVDAGRLVAKLPMPWSIASENACVYRGMQEAAGIHIALARKGSNPDQGLLEPVRAGQTGFKGSTTPCLSPGYLRTTSLPTSVSRKTRSIHGSLTKRCRSTK